MQYTEVYGNHSHSIRSTSNGGVTYYINPFTKNLESIYLPLGSASEEDLLEIVSAIQRAKLNEEGA